MTMFYVSCIVPSIKTWLCYLPILAAVTIFDVVGVGTINYLLWGALARLKVRVVYLEKDKMNWQLSAMTWVNDVSKALGEPSSSMGISEFEEQRLKIARDHLSIMIERGKKSKTFGGTTDMCLGVLFSLLTACVLTMSLLVPPVQVLCGDAIYRDQEF